VACLHAITGETPPVDPTTPLGRWLAPLTKLVRTLDLEDLSTPEAMLKVVEESVRMQVANVANTAPVQAAWATGRKGLWVHGLIYDLSTGRLRDLDVTRGPPMP
jgi:carbonic anhydrase